MFFFITDFHAARGKFYIPRIEHDVFMYKPHSRRTVRSTQETKTGKQGIT